jgi:Flp pilus assembly protein TadD
MPTLSFIMIVKNEEHCLGECLGAIHGVADEIVVVDTGSSDGTVAVAQEYGAKVVEIPWDDDFAEARNRSIQEATGDWLLHLDADEIVDPAGVTRIRELIDEDGAGADAIEVTLANYCDTLRAWRWVPSRSGDPLAKGRAGYIAVGLLRLFRNHRGFEYRDAVHENITASVREGGGVVREEDILIHHYGYGSEGERGREKAALYLELGRKKAEANPGEPKAWHDYAEQALTCGDADSAEAACRKALALDATHLAASTTLANILLNRGDLDDARVILEGLESTGQTAGHVVMALGAIACRQGRLTEALARLEAVIDAVPDHVMGLLHLARTLDRLGDPNAARARLEQALAAAPAQEELQHRLEAHQLRSQGEAHFAAADPNSALVALVQSLRLDPDDPRTHSDLGVVLHAIGQPVKAKESFRRALRLAPGMPEARANLDALEAP